MSFATMGVASSTHQQPAADDLGAGGAAPNPSNPLSRVSCEPHWSSVVGAAGKGVGMIASRAAGTFWGGEFCSRDDHRADSRTLHHQHHRPRAAAGSISATCSSASSLPGMMNEEGSDDEDSGCDDDEGQQAPPAAAAAAAGGKLVDTAQPLVVAGLLAPGQQSPAGENGRGCCWVGWAIMVEVVGATGCCGRNAMHPHHHPLPAA